MFESSSRPTEKPSTGFFVNSLSWFLSRIAPYEPLCEAALAVFVNLGVEVDVEGVEDVEDEEDEALDASVIQLYQYNPANKKKNYAHQIMSLVSFLNFAHHLLNDPILSLDK